MGEGRGSLLLSDKRQRILASLGNDAPAHTKMDLDWHTNVHGTCICLRVTPIPTTTPHLQVNISNPLEHPLVGPDHGVYILSLAASPALLEGLVGRETVGQSGGQGSTLR